MLSVEGVAVGVLDISVSRCNCSAGSTFLILPDESTTSVENRFSGDVVVVVAGTVVDVVGTG